MVGLQTVQRGCQVQHIQAKWRSASFASSSGLSGAIPRSSVMSTNLSNKEEIQSLKWRDLLGIHSLQLLTASTPQLRLNSHALCTLDISPRMHNNIFTHLSNSARHSSKEMVPLASVSNLSKNAFIASWSTALSG